MFSGSSPARSQGRLGRFFRLLPPVSPAPARLGGLLTASELETRFRAERDRTDRSGQAFSLLVFTPGDPHHGDPMAAAAILLGRLRIYDGVGRLDSSRLGALLPETDALGAWAAVDGLVERMGEAGLAYDCEVYSYPSDWSGSDQAGRFETIPLRPDELEEESPSTGTVRPFLAVTASRRPRPIREPGLDLARRSAGSRVGRSLEPFLVQKLPLGKRVVDILFASALLVALSPLFLLVALLVKLTSQGNVFYTQARAGLGGRPFSFYKFRTMYRNADALAREYRARNMHRDGPIFKDPQDPRVTPVGRILRRTSIDELPQLLNVLLGQMTLVGPRPPRIEEVEEYEPWQMRRLEVTGGLTCLWQVRGRSEIGFLDWVRMDLEYIRRRSAWLDCKVLVRTVGAVVSGRGAY